MNYRLFNASLKELIRDIPHPLANLANASAFLWESLPDLNWAGFYLREETAEGEPLLVLGPFQGRPACIEIPWGKGVCGSAAAADRTFRVADVHEFPGHIACDAASASEIVIPLHDKNGRVAGVLDIDSPLPARFDENDQAGLEETARLIEKYCF